MKEDKLKIQIVIRSNKGVTGINRDNFDKAILDLINEREWYNFPARNKLFMKVKKAFKKK